MPRAGKTGRPPKYGTFDILAIEDLRRKNYSYREIAEELKIGVSTVHRLLHPKSETEPAR